MSPCSNTFWFLLNSRIVFPAPTLARKTFASNSSLAGFPIGASFGSTNVISPHRREHATSSCSIEAPRLSHDTGHLCQKSGVSDRHGRSLWASQSFNLGTELLRERVDDARAEPGFWLSKDTVRLPNSIVSDRKLPICSRNFIRNGDLSIFC